MCRAWSCTIARAVFSITAISASIGVASPAAAQVAGWYFGADATVTTAAPRGPLARLVDNPDRAGGLPPYALADQSGAIQRYVEPVPGIDLAPYVGQVIVVRHDTGRTLLASQLELPMQPLYPMVGDAGRGGGPPGSLEQMGAAIQQAQHVDDDDTTVELLEDGEELPNGKSVLQTAPSGTMPEGMMYPGGGHPSFPDGSMPPVGPGFGPPGYDPTQCDPSGMDPSQMEWMPGEMGAEPCPHCGRYHGLPGSPGSGRLGKAFHHPAMASAHLFADIELNFFRLHLNEGAVGKLSEKYEFSPRFILGFTGVGPVDGRVRYWHYGRTTSLLNDDGNIRFEFDVLDLEAMHYFGGKRSEVVLGAGLRLASVDLVDVNDSEAGADLLGLTMAADGRTGLSKLKAGRLAWVYGGRLSILGGDWDSDDEQRRNIWAQDDNVVVHELYAGLELARCVRGFDAHFRLAFEMQNWHSDVIAASHLNTDSIGILGPGLRVGAEF